MNAGAVGPSNATPPSSRCRILYIGGTGRTGSTVLDSLLGAFPGVFAGGELAYLWRLGLGAGGRCSCGRILTECEVWNGVLAGLGGVPDAQHMVELRRVYRSTHLPLMFSARFRRRRLHRIRELSDVLDRLYSSIAETTGARLIVDSSKEPHYSSILRDATRHDVFFLHLVRDPRAVGMSWRRRRSEPGLATPGLMEQRGAVRASAYYDISNVAAEALWRRSGRYAFLRYEDLVREPHRALREIGRFVGVELDVDAVVDTSGTFERPRVHAAWGNPNRFERGRTSLRADMKWVESLPRSSGAALAALTAPLLLRYGYPVGRGSPLARPRDASLRRHQVAAPDGTGVLADRRPAADH